MGSNNLIFSHSTGESLKAEMAAAAGIQHAARRLSRDATFTGLAATTMPAGGANYTVSVTQGGNPAPEPAPSAVNPIPAGHFYLLATGVTDNGTTRRVGWLVTRSDSLFSTAGFGFNSVELKENSRTDTWDSRIFPFDYAGTKDPGAGVAHIGTNNVGASSVKFEVGARLDPATDTTPTGKVLAPSGADPSVTIDDGAGGQWLGPGIQTIAPQPTPPVDMLGHDVSSQPGQDVTGVQPLTPGDYGDLVVKPGGTLVLAPGEYYFKTLKLEPNSTLQLPLGAAAPTVCKIQDGFQMFPGSSINNLVKKARMLEIQVKSGDSDIIAGADLDSTYCTIYSPTQKVTLKENAGGGHLFGAIKARDLVLEKDTQLHFDKDLTGLSTPGAGSLKLVTSQRF